MNNLYTIEFKDGHEQVKLYADKFYSDYGFFLFIQERTVVYTVPMDRIASIKTTVRIQGKSVSVGPLGISAEVTNLHV